MEQHVLGCPFPGTGLTGRLSTLVLLENRDVSPTSADHAADEFRHLADALGRPTNQKNHLLAQRDGKKGQRNLSGAKSPCLERV